MQNISGKKIALGVCGSISAYKAVEIARELTQLGADVRVVMTPSAVNFVGPITFATLTGNPVRTELFPQTAAAEIVHTDLARTSDLIVVAPATAKLLAKYARGISDDLMSAMLLAAACPVVLAPAMHSEMWEDAATRANVEALVAGGVVFVGPESGALAGPEAGVGRLASTEAVIEEIDEQLAARTRLEGVRVVVTAGGTREPIDDVRYIGNHSTGLMGYELAREALRRGAAVTLISAPTQRVAPRAATVVPVVTAAEMGEAVVKALKDADALIMCGAVSDWQPAEPFRGKLRRLDGPPELKLVPAPDILAEVASLRRSGELPAVKAVVGFCAELDDLEKKGTEKLKAKDLDLMVANQVGVPDSGFIVNTNRAVIIHRGGPAETLPLLPKGVLARKVAEELAALLRPI